MKNLSTECLRFAHLAYRSPDQTCDHLEDLGSQVLAIINDVETDTQGFICKTIDDTIVVSFRGTTNLHDWVTNSRVTKVPFGLSPELRVHSGFEAASTKALNAVYSTILSFPDLPVVFVGHSLGGALAILTAFRIGMLGLGNCIHAIETFGAPRVGDYRFAKSYDAMLGSRTARHVCRRDVVARVPSVLHGYRHVGQLKYYDSFGTCISNASWLYRLIDGLASYPFTTRSRTVRDHLLNSYECVETV